MNEVYDEKGRVVSLDIPLPFAQCTYVIVYVRHYRSIDLNVSLAWVFFLQHMWFETRHGFS